MGSCEIKKVIVVGSGTMGPGIALTFAKGGLEVFLVDINEEILQKGLRKIHESLDIFNELGVVKDYEKEAILKRVHITTNLEWACRQGDYFMEAVPEVLEIKQKIHQQADEWCNPQVILASNTSHMKIEQIATSTKRRDRVVGTHWVNPPEIMQLVEIVKSNFTSDKTIECVKNLLERVGKAPIVCKDTISYINNALQGALSQKALELYEKGIATAEDIDRAVNTGFGFRLPLVGPFAFYDMAGLDLVKDGWNYLNTMMGGNRGPFPHFLDDLVKRGHLGLKTGKGIYSYSKDEVDELAKERKKQLIQMLKVLGRI